MKHTFKKIIANVLQFEARCVLKKYKPKIIAITGSVGKTSTKDAVYAVLSSFAHVRKSDKSYNSEIGLPLTILGLPNAWNNPLLWIKNILLGFWLIIWAHRYPKWLVLEVGVGKPGDMKKTASWLKTDAVIITTMGTTPAHIEFFSSFKHLVEEKSGLIKTLWPDGLLVLNQDDEAVRSMKQKTKARTLTYGFSDGADILGSGESIFYDEEHMPRGISFRIDEGGVSLPVFIDGVFGRNHVYASLAALALSSGLKWNMLEAINAVKSYDVPPGRMRLLRGINGSYVIDDTYNSSPFAAEAALKTLGEIATANKGTRGRSKAKNSVRKIAVLGDMLELGKHTEEAHTNIGKIASTHADILVVVGPRAQDIKHGALGAGMPEENILEFSNSYLAGESLKTFIEKNDLVLVKGSQGMRMERAVEAILDPELSKEKYLVRQDQEWKDKK